MTTSGADVLAVPMRTGNDAGVADVGGYLVELLALLWKGKEKGFSSVRPFGNTGWDREVYGALIEAGLLKGTVDEIGRADDFNQGEAEALVMAGIAALHVARPVPGGLLPSVRLPQLVGTREQVRAAFTDLSDKPVREVAVVCHRVLSGSAVAADEVARQLAGRGVRFAVLVAASMEPGGFGDLLTQACARYGVGVREGEAHEIP